MNAKFCSWVVEGLEMRHHLAVKWLETGEQLMFAVCLSSHSQIKDSYPVSVMSHLPFCLIWKYVVRLY